VPEPPFMVYKYFKINTSIPEHSIKEAQITFFVSRSWLDQLGLIEYNIIALKYDGEEWIELPTKMISENKTHLVFKTRTSGFSVFAIVDPKPTPTSITLTVCPKWLLSARKLR